ELFGQLIGADADTVSDQAAKFFLKKALSNQVFEHRNCHLETLLDLRGVLIHADRAVTTKGRRKELLYAVSDFFVRDLDAEESGFVFDLLGEHQLIENLARVQAFKSLGHLIAPLDFGELLANLG